MSGISGKDFETYERIKKFMIKHRLSEEDLRRDVKCKIHLKISSEGMEPSTFEKLSDASMFIGGSRQTLTYAHKHKRPLITRRKGGAKVFFIEWLEAS